ncbi:MAG: polysaccharide biosynthesis protein, partial [Terrisporobacter sp.]
MDAKIEAPQKESVLENILGKYKTRQLILIGTDIACTLLSFIASVGIVYPTRVDSNLTLEVALIYAAINILMLSICRCYNSLWRYAGEEELISIVLACGLTLIPTYLIHLFMGVKLSLTFYVLNLILTTSLTGGTRLLYRTGRRIRLRNSLKEKTTNVLIVGAGSAGDMVIQELKNNPQLL